MSVPTELTDEQIEHLAYGVAMVLDRDDADEIETLCDAALHVGGRSQYYRSQLLTLIANYIRIEEWMTRGANLGYLRRSS